MRVVYMCGIGILLGMLSLLNGCGNAPPVDLDTPVSDYLAINVAKFGGDAPIPAQINIMASESKAAHLPEDLLEIAPDDEVVMFLGDTNIDVRIDGQDNGSDAERHAILLFRLAGPGEDPCTSTNWIGPFTLTIRGGRVSVDMPTLPLTLAARELVRSGAFEICAQSSADFDGLIAIHKLFVEFGSLRASEDKVELCHIPPGNPENAHTIMVAPAAVAAHLAHGDYLGPCAGDTQDSDGDGVSDLLDLCPDTPAGEVVDSNGCSCAQLGNCVSDVDGDGVPDGVDACPDTPTGASVDYTGCSCAQRDSDGDGVNDCNDQCPNTLAGEPINESGCPLNQLDDDQDGVINGSDACPNTPVGAVVDERGCSCEQLDEDGDGVSACHDLCPDTPPRAAVDGFGCPTIVVNAGKDIVLNEVQPVTLQGTASGGTSPYTFSWSAPGWEGSFQQNPMVMPAQTTTYTLTVTDWSMPPKSATDTVTITVRANDERRYTIVNLGSLSNNSSYPSGINETGQVVGYYYTDTMLKRAFLYSGGKMTDLGTLGGSEAYARAINGVGQVVGQAKNVQGNWRAFSWTVADGMRDLGTLGGTSSVAYGINKNGQVVGYAGTGSASHAFLYSNGTMRDLGTLGYLYSAAFGINDYGQVAGAYLPAGGEQQAFLWNPTGFVDLGSPLLSGSQAWAINNLGMVAGYSWGGSDYRSFLYANGLVVDLGTMDEFTQIYAWGINNTGQVVGYMSNPTGSLSHAFLYAGGKLYDLNDLLAAGHGWEYLTAAFAINDRGQIAGYGRINGQFRGFLLTPTP